MFQIKGPIIAAMDLDKGSDELLRQADALARSYKVKLSVCHVLPEIFAVQPLFPQLHLGDAQRPGAGRGNQRRLRAGADPGHP